ncbi:hypothetical protein RHA1_ro08001 (plasmid) [Rhodococcus jostii RHA1]|uniref:Uncharacterized protein n=1 Tax=Rhodococcus jostii (strain RHA1) TaxID=101510 RepID=Q0S088_RHOJR|nr:hypothetical protein RHA1_ro08001 [Rhodococcus jostii RHA1]
MCITYVNTYSPIDYSNTLPINNFQKRFENGRNRHPRARRQPGAGAPPTRCRRPHITNRGHVITPGHSTITPAGAEVASIPPITTCTPPRMGSREFSSSSRRSRRRLGRERVMVFERFSDQARHVVVLAAGAARTHHQNWSRHRPPTPGPARRPRLHQR